MSEIIRPLSTDLYEYHPGNATRYMVLATAIKPSIYDGACAAFMWLDCGDRGGRGMIFDPKQSFDLWYFQNKTRIENEPDAVALACFLAEFFSAHIEGIPKSYNQQDWFRNAKVRTWESFGVNSPALEGERSV